MRIPTLLACCALAGPVLAGSALAQPKPPSAPSATSAASTTSAAPATETPEAKSKRLRAEGDRLIDIDLFEDALAAYDEAYAASPSPSLLYNRGRALQFLARYPEALASFERFTREAPPDVLARVPTIKSLLAELRGKVASLTVHCNVPGATVLVDNRKVAVMPASEAIHLNAGEHAVEVTAEGYFPYKKTLKLDGGTATVIPADLGPRDTSAVLQVESRVAAAHVRVDDKPLGLAPAQVTLRAGQHRVTVEREGYDPATTQVVLRAGETRSLTVDPLQRPGVLSRWWFWSAVGVVVVAAGTIAIAASIERSPPQGSFSPGLVKF